MQESWYYFVSLNYPFREPEQSTALKGVQEAHKIQKSIGSSLDGEFTLVMRSPRYKLHVFKFTTKKRASSILSTDFVLPSTSCDTNELLPPTSYKIIFAHQYVLVPKHMVDEVVKLKGREVDTEIADKLSDTAIPCETELALNAVLFYQVAKVLKSQKSSMVIKMNTSTLSEKATFSMFRDSRPDFVAYDVESMRGFFGTIDLGDADSDHDAAGPMGVDEAEGFTIESKLSQERSLAQILGNAEKMATDMACAILAGGRPFKKITIWALNVIYKRGVASVHKISLDFDNKVSEVVTGNTELEVSEAINRLVGLALK